MRRDPVRFDVFSALAHYTAKHHLSIRDDKTISQFLDAIRGTTTDSLSNDAFVYGFRVQSMFETVIASLGKIQLLKQEDSGTAYHASNVDLAIPDYRIVLDRGVQLLVEVKSFSQKTGTEPYIEDAAYLRSLDAYAKLTQAELLIALYWHRWNLWTLVPPSTFASSGTKAQLGLPEALAANRMGLLGDKMVGTRPPLRLRMEVDELRRDGEERLCSIKSVTIYSEDRLLKDPVERRIATFLILNGSWHETTELQKNDDGEDSVLELSYAPYEDDGTQSKQGFVLMGSLSSMISTFFRRGTVDEGDSVKGFNVDFSPGEFGQLIPNDYKFGEAALPLFLLTVVTGDTPGRQAPP